MQPSRALLVGIVLSFCLFASWQGRNYLPFGVFNDDAGYWLQAQCLTGQRQASDFPMGMFTYPTLGQGLMLMPPCWIGQGSAEWGRVWMTLWAGVAGLAAFVLASDLLRSQKTAQLDLRPYAVACFCVLNQSAFAHQTTLMSDSTLALVCLVYLALPDAWPVDDKRWLYRGFLCAAAYYVRVTGIALVVTEAAILFSRRQWKRLFWLTLGFLSLAAPYQMMLSLLSQGVDTYWSAASKGSISLASTVLNYFGHLPRLLGNAFFGDFTWGLYFGIALIVTSFFGACKLWVRDGHGDRKRVLFTAFFLVGHSVWPYPFGRYFVVVSPLLLAFSLFLWPRFTRTGCLLWLAFTLPGDAKVLQRSKEVEPLLAPRNQIYRWLGTNLPPQTEIATVFDNRAAALSGRRFQKLQPAEFTSGLLYYLALSKVDWLLLENTPLAENFQGKQQVSFPAHLPHWLAHSSLVRVLLPTPWGVVYVLTPQARSLLSAYPHYLTATRNLANAGVAESQLRRALQNCSDFPEAEELLATLLLEQNRLDEGCALLEGLWSRYPCAFRAAYNLVLAYRQTGKDPGQVLKAAQESARALGDVEFQENFRRLESQLR